MYKFNVNIERFKNFLNGVYALDDVVSINVNKNTVSTFIFNSEQTIYKYVETKTFLEPENNIDTPLKFTFVNAGSISKLFKFLGKISKNLKLELTPINKKINEYTVCTKIKFSYNSFSKTERCASTTTHDEEISIADYLTNFGDDFAFEISNNSNVLKHISDAKQFLSTNIVTLKSVDGNVYISTPDFNSLPIAETDQQFSVLFDINYFDYLENGNHKFDVSENIVKVSTISVDNETKTRTVFKNAREEA